MFRFCYILNYFLTGASNLFHTRKSIPERCFFFLSPSRCTGCYCKIYWRGNWKFCPSLSYSCLHYDIGKVRNHHVSPNYELNNSVVWSLLHLDGSQRKRMLNPKEKINSNKTSVPSTTIAKKPCLITDRRKKQFVKVRSSRFSKQHVILKMYIQP